MIFLISIVLAAVFVHAAGKVLKKHPVPFYIAAVVIALGVLVLTWNRVRFPGWINTWVWPVFSRAAFSTALFVIVMVTGALPNGSAAIKKLMPVRGELSIIASILTLGHNASYGLTYFRLLFTNPSRMPVNQVAAAVCSIVMLAIMLPLFITSFKKVRRKISGKAWKKLQRLAYGFYALIYIHVMLLHVPYALEGRAGYKLNVFLYSGVFISYCICRVLKYAAKRAPAPKALLKKQAAGIVCGVASAALIMIPVAAAGIASENTDDSTNLTAQGEMSEDTQPSEKLSRTVDPERLDRAEQPAPRDLASESEEPNRELPEEPEYPPGDTGENLEFSESASSEPASEPIPLHTSEPEPENSSVSPESAVMSSEDPPSAPTVEPSSTFSSESTPETEPDPEPEPEPTPATVYKNGTFTGSAQGYWAAITVSVTINDDVITSIIVTDHDEDPEFFSDAQAVTDRIISAQSTDVDTVSGATYSSGGIIDAVADALASARN